MLQMCLLRDEAGKTWSDTEMFLQKLCGEVPPHRIKTVIESNVRAAEKITSGFDSEIVAFFQTKVVIQPEVGPFAADFVLNPASLKDCSFSVFCSRPTNGLILELERFRVKNGLPHSVLGTWLSRLAGKDDSTIIEIPLPSLSKKWTN